MSERAAKSRDVQAGHMKPEVAADEHAASTASLDALLDKRSEKDALIEQSKDLATVAFDTLSKASAGAVAELDVLEVPHSDLVLTLLGMAAETVVGGLAGKATHLLIGQVMHELGGTIEHAIKKAVVGPVERALHHPEKRKAKSLQDLRFSFREAIDLQLVRARTRFVAEWPNARAALDAIKTDQLKELNRLTIRVDPTPLYEETRHQTFVAWANFLARAKHGAMTKGWDFWQENGSAEAVALTGAAARPSGREEDPTTSNVAPASMVGMMGPIQRPMEKEHFGVLEVFVYETVSGVRIVGKPGYRMRLDNVGPRVREELVKHGGNVRDVPVNKIIRICSDHYRGQEVNPPVPVAAVLVTADGYVRASEGFDQLHFEPRQDAGLFGDDGFGECLDRLRAGNEDASCHRVPADRNVRLRQLAEAAQDLPISWLGAR